MSLFSIRNVNFKLGNLPSPLNIPAAVQQSGITPIPIISDLNLPPLLPVFLAEPKTSLARYDNGDFPVHRRGISVQRPEVIGTFDFRPLFGSSFEQLTPEGKFVDVQINARKIRIDDIRTLFNDLLEGEDPEISQLTQTLIDQLENEFQKTETDIETINRVMTSIFSFISSLNLKKQPARTLRRQEELRALRIDENSFLSSGFSDALTFNQMLGRYHGFSDNDIANFANTKLLLYQMADLKHALKGPIAGIQERSSIPGFPTDTTSYAVSAPGSNTSFIARNLVEIHAPPYNRGILSTKTHLQVNDQSNLTNGVQESPRIYEPAAQRTAKSIAKSCLALSQDFAFSSALGDNDFMRSMIGDFPVRRNDSFGDVVFGDLPTRSSNIFSLTNLQESATMLSDLLYTTATDQATTPAFDPDIATYPFASLESNSKKFKSSFDRFVKPILTSASTEEGMDVQELRNFEDQITTRLRSTAQSLSYITGINEPGLAPEKILKDVLEVFDQMIGTLGSNTQQGGTPGTGHDRRPIDFEILGLLSEAHLNQEQSLEFQRFLDHTDTFQTTVADYVNIHNLLALYLVGIVKSNKIAGNHFLDLLAGVRTPADQEDDANFIDQFANEIPAAILNTLNRCLENYARVQYDDHLSVGNTDVLPGAVDVSTLAAGPLVNTSYEKRWTRFRYVWANLTRFNSELETEWSVPGSDGETLKISSTSHATVIRRVVEEGWIFKEEKAYGIQTYRSVGTRQGSREGSRSGQSPDFRFDVNVNKPFQVVPASQVSRILSSLYSDPTSSSFVTGFVRILDNLLSAAMNRGPVVGVHADGGGKMLASGVDVGAIASLLLNIFSLISYKLCTVELFTLSNESYAGNGVGIQVKDYRKLAEFSDDVKAYLEGGVENITTQNSALLAFINEFNEVVNESFGPVIEYADFCNALANQIQSEADSLVSAMIPIDDAELDDEDLSLPSSMARVSSNLSELMNFPQVVLSRNEMEGYKKRTGYERYFDNFLVNPADENFFYSALRSKSFSFPDGDNMSILCVGIPDGFTQNVLKIDGVSQPEKFQDERKIDIVVRKTDLILGDQAQAEEKVYTFDLNVFFDSFIDPITSNESTRTERITDPVSGNPDYYRDITEREYPAREEVISKNILMRRYDVATKTFQAFDGASASIPSDVFENHVNDKLAKMYARIAFGCDLSSNQFFLDVSKDEGIASKEELSAFNQLMAEQIRKVAGKDLNIDQFLSQDREARELFNRLTKGKRSAPLLSTVDESTEGVSEDASFLTSEDLVVFSRMLAPTNPFAVPATTGRNVISPKAFERVFCILIDPDKFELRQTEDVENAMSNPSTSRFLKSEQGKVSYREVTKEEKIEQAFQYQVYIRKHGAVTRES